MGANCETPVAVFLYNRPDTTARMIEAVAAVEPETLYVVADGPVDERDAERCAAARAAVEDRIDWDCDVRRTYRERNHGVASVHEGIDWVFEREREAIFVEDDCVPNESFFEFCEAMLERYRDDERIMSVNGTNRHETWKADRQDYHFVTYQGVWGWATWRRAWEHYDPEMREWADPEVRNRVRDVICDDEQVAYQFERFRKRYEGESVAWSKPWRFAITINNGLSVVPARNLVSNIGFDERGIHTTDPESDLAEIPRYELSAPYEGPDAVAPDRRYQRTYFERFERTSRREKALEYGTRRGKQLAARLLPPTITDALKRRLEGTHSR
ncbi:glycosyltransferase family 2 protein [Natronococcus sp. JC468]|uniref:glycosyltransferase family 2 protein n=1 Tax=Natronococcus sp. JC468 TaxID=1961921 RepID=UPI00143B2CEF|nr:glycosyltransferase family 2 protein [Natronococcus sp. JC468]NKE34920.1 glycosyltransferase family 2 protein [Natronococcus sp. JC468]